MPASSMRTGLIIGGGLGAAVGVLAVAANCENRRCFEFIRSYPVIILTTAAGAALGAVIDALITDR